MQVHPSLCCVSVQAKNDAAAGNQTGAKQKGRVALALNIAAVIIHVVGVILIIISVPVGISSTYAASPASPGLHEYYCKYCSYISPACTYSYSYSSYSYSYSYSYYYASYYCTY